MKKRIHILDVPFDPVTYHEVLLIIKDHVDQKKKLHIITSNPEMIVHAQDNHEFFQVLRGADLTIPDGVGVLWASTYLRLPRRKLKVTRHVQLLGSLVSLVVMPWRHKKVLPDRVTGTDLLQKVVEYSQQHHWKIFLLGAGSGVAQKAIHCLKKQFPHAQFAGHFTGSPSHHEEGDICDRINKANPDILFVAYGSPAQELWIHRNLFKLNTVKVAVGVGGAFDFAAGKAHRAPRFLRATGLEWLWRFFREPKRIKRIWNATGVFVGMVIREKYPT